MKHLNLLKAWADGKPVEYFVRDSNEGGSWVSLPSPDRATVTPEFHDNLLYRLAPIPHRVVLITRRVGPAVVISEDRLYLLNPADDSNIKSVSEPFEITLPPPKD